MSTRIFEKNIFEIFYYIIQQINHIFVIKKIIINSCLKRDSTIYLVCIFVKHNLETINYSSILRYKYTVSSYN